jgi:L-alanine-DL-glutamate epimerase-like enolase superfamily enzyme
MPVGAGVLAGAPVQPKAIRITRAASNFERDPLSGRLGFKGQYMTEKWQIATYLESESGHSAVGLCSQSVLWSDGDVFASHSEAAGNALMYAMLDGAARRVRGVTFRDPIQLLDEIYPATFDYGVRITGKKSLRETFALMALVSLDYAAWLLYARENGFRTFGEMIPEPYRASLSNRHNRVAAIPLLSYTVPLEEISRLVRAGSFFLKIKIGAPGSQPEMLRKDMERLERIHEAVGQVENPHTKDGKPRYYLDANGRYERKDTLMRLLDHAAKIGALEQIALIEEPLPEENEDHVSGLGVRIAADESAHTDASVEERIDMGYSAVAIKGAAKTLSMSLRVIRAAEKRGVPCFCADSAAIPILVDWNKNLAARLRAFPGLQMGLLESNGSQNYAHWDRLMSYHPCAGASWIEPRNGVFHLTEEFYRKSGGIFLESPHYRSLFS